MLQKSCGQLHHPKYQIPSDHWALRSACIAFNDDIDKPWPIECVEVIIFIWVTLCYWSESIWTLLFNGTAGLTARMLCLLSPWQLWSFTKSCHQKPVTALMTFQVQSFKKFLPHASWNFIIDIKVRVLDAARHLTKWACSKVRSTLTLIKGLA